MAFYSGDNWDFSIEEWWDKEGDYHTGEPSEDELLGAFQVTGHLIDHETGEERFTTFFSGDDLDHFEGWTYEELEAEIEDYFEEGTP